MSSLTITNTFANATTADATQVNTNFSDVKSFVDSHCVHKGETALEAKTGTPGKKFQAGAISGTTNASGDLVVTFPVAFAATVEVVHVQEETPGGVGAWTMTRVLNRTSTTFTVHALDPDGALVASTAITGTYMAIGT